MNNEIMGFNDTTLCNTNRAQRIDDMGCKFRHWVVYYLKNLEKEIQSGDLYARNGRILHASRNSKISQDRRGLCYPSTSTEKNARVQIGRFLESQQKRISRVPSQQEEYPRQKIKPPRWWQETTKERPVARQLSIDWNPFDSCPNKSLPIFSIALTKREVKVSQNMGVRKKEGIPMESNHQNWTQEEWDEFTRDYESHQIRNYDRSKVTNTFAIGEQIEWVEWVTDSDHGVLSIYQTGIIKKITSWTVVLEINGQEQRLDKPFLENRAADFTLKRAIRETFGQSPSSSKSAKNKTPHDAYRLRDPRDKSVFYVGISKNSQRRYKQHLACAGLNFKLNIRIQEILQCGLIPQMEIIEPAISGAEKAREREKYWINHHVQVGDQLTNIAEMDEVE